MKRITFFLLILIAIVTSVNGQIFFDTLKSVKISATIDTEEPKITLKWVQDTEGTQYEVYKKDPRHSQWGAPIFVSLDGNNTFSDNGIEIGNLYEYRVKKVSSAGIGNGYIYSGIDFVSTINNQGIIIVVDHITYDSTFTALKQFSEILASEGWLVSELIIDINASVQSIRDSIQNLYDQYPDISSILLFGNVPVPHSGNINPDAHSDHKGGWPADLYYGELNGNWTDETVNNTTSANPRNHNVPGDGNLDQAFIPDSVDLAVGRIDFSELPVYQENEFQLLRNYLSKNIAFRTKIYVPRQRALFKNRNTYSEGLGQNALRNFPVLVSSDSIVYFDFFDGFKESFLFSYGASGGSQISSPTLGNINTYANNDFQVIFTGYFGSYYGDYDFENNLLRTILASGKVLTTAWVGAPHWFFHPMGMGFTMGHSTLLTQNNQDTYHSGDFPRGVHTNLLGDPTLKAFIVKPPTDLQVSFEGNAALLRWKFPEEDILGFNVYRKVNTERSFEKLNENPITTTSYIDSCATSFESSTYVVRAVKREFTPSGIFINESSGSLKKVDLPDPIFPVSDFEYVIDGNTITTINLSTENINNTWLLSNDSIFYEENILIEALDNEPMEITLIVSNHCYSDTATRTIILSSTHHSQLENSIDLHPNPISKDDKIKFIATGQKIDQLIIYNAKGQRIQQLNNLDLGRHEISVPDYKNDFYILTFIINNEMITKKVLVID